MKWVNRIFPKRILPPGDPSKFVLWRWMDIHGPNATGPDSLYLRRLYVFRCPLGGLMIHWIHREDWDRDAMHSHPWKMNDRSSFWSYVAKGGYTEELATILGDRLVKHRTETHRRGWHAFGLDDVHRISAVEPGTVTVCVTGKKRSGWGFWVADGDAPVDAPWLKVGKIVPWREYIDQFGRDGAR